MFICVHHIIKIRIRQPVKEANDEPYPYIVPVNFGEEIIGNQVIFYIHTGYEGKKNDYHPETVKFNPKFVHMTQCMKIVVNDMTAKRAMPKKDTPDYKVMQFQGEVRSPHM